MKLINLSAGDRADTDNIHTFFDSNGLKYRNDSLWWYRWYLEERLALLIGFGASSPIVYYAQPWWKKLINKRYPSLSEISKRLGFDIYSQKRCRACERLWIFRFLLVIVVFPFVYYFFVFHLNEYIFDLIGVLVGFSLNEKLQELDDNLYIILIAILYVPFLYIYVTFFFKLSNSIIDRLFGGLFANSLLIRTVLYLLVELSHQDAIHVSELRKLIIYRINSIRYYNKLIGNYESSLNKYHSKWIESHFKKIDDFIQERQRWAIVPMATTRIDLERDFIYLVNFYLNNRIGDFNWLPETKINLDLVSIKQHQSNNNWIKKLRRLLLGIFPLLIFGLLLSQHILQSTLNDNSATEIQTWITSSGIKPEMIALISIAWLLLIVDRTLNLGFLDSLVNIAKGVKDLTK